MHDSDLTEKTAREFDTEVPTVAFAIRKVAEPLSRMRAAHGTHVGLRALPPPIPARAKRWTEPLRSLPSEPRGPAPTAPPAKVEVVDVKLSDPDAATECFDRLVPRRRNAGAIGGIIAGVMVVGGLGLGLGFGGPEGDDVKPTAVTTAIAAMPPPVSVSAPPVRSRPPIPRASTKPPPALTAALELRIVSVPPGASVMLIGDGEATVVGRTPITASIDPARVYDVVFALRGHTTKIHHLDPSATQVLVIDLADPSTPRQRTNAVPGHRKMTPKSPAGRRRR